MNTMIKKCLAVALAAVFTLAGCSESGGGVGYTGGGSGGGMSGGGYTTISNEAQAIIDARTNLNYDTMSVQLDANVSIEDFLVDILEENGIELYGINKAGITMNVGLGGNAVGMRATGAVNDVHIASAEAFVGLDSGDVYITVPEVNPTAIKVETGESIYSALGNSEEIAKLQKEFLELEKIILRFNTEAVLMDYLSSAVDTIGEPDETFEAYVEAGDFSKKMKGESYIISTEDAYNVVTVLLEKLKTDNNIKQLVSACLPEIVDILEIVSPEDADEFAQLLNGNIFDEALIPAIDEALAEIEESKAYSAEEDLMEVVAYYDGNEFAGCELSVVEYGSMYEVLGVYSVTDGDYYAFEIEIPDACNIIVDGKISNGKFTGDFELVSADGIAMNFGLKYVDVDMFKYGIFDGTIVFDDSILGYQTPAEFEGFKLEIDVANTVHNSSIDARVYYEDNLLGTVNLMLAFSDRGCPVSIPSNYALATDDAAGEQWIENMTLSTLLSNLEKAGVSSSLVASMQGTLQ